MNILVPFASNGKSFGSAFLFFLFLHLECFWIDLFFTYVSKIVTPDARDQYCANLM